MLNIKIFSDFACPFCYIALGILERLEKDGVEFDEEWHVYEMRPEMPLEGEDFSLKATEEQKEKIEKLYEILTTLGNSYGLKFSNKYIRFNTKRAHLAAEYAKTQGKYNEFSRQIFKAYFEDGKNIADKEILNEIASMVGLNPDEMNQEVDEGKFNHILSESQELIDKHNVEGAPTFIVNDEHKMTGVRNYDQFKNTLIEFSK